MLKCDIKANQHSEDRCEFSNNDSTPRKHLHKGTFYYFQFWKVSYDAILHATQGMNKGHGGLQPKQKIALTTDNKVEGGQWKMQCVICKSIFQINLFEWRIISPHSN